MPGVQTLVPLLLDHVANAGRLTLERLVDLTSAGPQRIFGLAGKGPDRRGLRRRFHPWSISSAEARDHGRPGWRAKCGWSPFEGMAVTGWPIATIVRGSVVMRDGALQGEPAGQPVRFIETLGAGA